MQNLVKPTVVSIIVSALIIVGISMSPFFEGLFHKFWYVHPDKVDHHSNEPKKGNPPWHIKMLEAQKAVSLNTQGIIFIYFSANWCTPCLQMEKVFFPSEEFNNFVKQYSIILLHYDMNDENLEGEKIAEKYFVTGLPTIILIHKDGTEIDKVVGFKSTRKTIEELAEVVTTNAHR